MNRRSSRPALYELIGESSSKPRTSGAPPLDDESDAPPPGNGLGGGRFVRLPVGYIGVGAVVILALISGAIWAGWQAGDKQARREAALADPMMRSSDPLVGEPTPGGENVPDPVGVSGYVPPPAPQATWGAITEDHREPGRSYFVLIATDKPGAIRIATFYRSQGVETYAIPSNNAGLHIVVAFPGFASDSDPAVSATKQRLLDIGVAWNATPEGHSNQEDMYLSRYTRSNR